MKLCLLTIVLDGMPWITRHWPEFEKLDFDWQWHVIEGVARNTACTSWCAPATPRLSNDGTTGYLDSLADYDHRVILHRKELWQGKREMVNAPLRVMHEPCLLVQVDSDELWTAEQLTRLRQLFIEQPEKNSARFHCDYRLGPNIHITSRGGFGNHDDYEWKRAWRWTPGMLFASHEPPAFERFVERPFTYAETEATGLVFRHEAYSALKQVTAKSRFYGSPNNKQGHLYANAVEGWQRLQRNRVWPVTDLKQYLRFVGAGVVADLVQKVP